MVAIFTGGGTGLERGSGSLLGKAGLLGSSSLGKTGEQLFVNAANGNLVVSQRDEILIGRGPDAIVSRTYNSQAAEGLDENRDRWRQSGDRRIVLAGTENAAGSVATRVSADGSEISYTWNGTRGLYVATSGAGAHDTLSLSNKVWTWVDGTTQAREIYQKEDVQSAYARITSETDRYGNSLTFTYFPEKGGNLQKITTADGGFIQYEWSVENKNNLRSITTGYTDVTSTPPKSATLTRTWYQYDNGNRLKTVTVDLSPENSNVADSDVYVTTYHYLSDGTNRIEMIEQSDGTLVKIGYTGAAVTSITEAGPGGTTRVTKLTYGTNYTLVTDPLEQVTRLDFDGVSADKWLKQITAPAAAGGLAQATTKFSYDAVTGDVLIIEDAAGDAATFTYDGAGNVLTETDPLGNIIRRTYGARNEILTETRESLVAPAESFEDGLSTGWLLNGAAAPVSGPFSGVGGSVSHFAGRFGWTGDGEALSKTFVLNGSGRTIIDFEFLKFDTWDGEAFRVYLNGGAAISFVPGQDASGTFSIAGLTGTYRITSSGQDSDLGIGPNAPDRAYHVQLAVAGTGSSVRLGFGSGLDQVPEDESWGIDNVAVREATTTRYVYDPSMALAYRVSAEGRVTAYENNQGLVSQERSLGNKRYPMAGLSPGAAIDYATIRNWELAITDWSGTSLISYQRDVRGEVEIARHWTNVAVNGYGRDARATEFGYDTAGNLVYHRVGNAFAETYRYDGLLRVESKKDSNGNETKLSYSVLSGAPGGVSSQTVVQLANGALETSSFDSLGRLINVVKSGGGATSTTSYRYDAAGRLRAIIDGTGQRSSILYDGAGRRAADIKPDGSVTEYRYSLDDNLIATIRHGAKLTNAQLESLVDAAGNPTNVLVVMPGAHADDRYEWRVYDQAGRLSGTIDGKGAVVQYVYDGAGRPISETRFANFLHASLVEGYRASGSPSSLPLPQENTNNDRILRNFYDRDGLLIATMDGDGALARTVYDGFGRKVQTIRYSGQILDPTARRTGSLASLEAIASGGDQSRTILHDYVYNSGGDLTAEVDGEGTITRYTYSLTGQLLTKTVGEKVLRTVPASSIPAPINAGDLVSTTGGATAETTTYDYDVYGKMRSERRDRAQGTYEWSIYTYDKLGRLETTDRHDVPSPDNRYNRFTKQRYDGLGRLIGEVGSEGSALLAPLPANAPASEIDRIYKTYGRTYSYDAAGRLISKTEPNGKDAGGNRTVYYYGIDGELAIEVNAAGDVIEYRRNAVGELTDTIRYEYRLPNGNLPGLTGGVAAEGAAIRALVAGLHHGVQITNNANTSVVSKGAGRFQITKAPGVAYGPNASAVSTEPFEGNFAFSVTNISPSSNYHVAISGAAKAADTAAIDYSFQIYNGTAYYYEAGVQVATKAINGKMWMWRTGTTLHYGTGPDWQSASSLSGIFRTIYNVAGPMHFDTLLFEVNSSMEVQFFDPQKPGLANHANALITDLGDGTFTIAKQGSTSNAWDASATSNQPITGDFRISARYLPYSPNLVIGVGTNVFADTSWQSVQYGLQLTWEKKVHALDNGVVKATRDLEGPDFTNIVWMWREGSTLRYGVGDNFEIASTSGLLHTVEGVTGDVHFDSSLYTSTSAVEVKIEYPELMSHASVEHVDYDAAGFVRATKDALNNSTSYTYNAFGQVASITRPLPLAQSEKTIFEYDRRGNHSKTVKDSGGLNLASVTSYDAFGRAWQTQDAHGYLRNTGYDRAGRVISVKDAAQKDAAQNEQTYEYDSRGYLRFSTDRNGKRTSYVYGALGRTLTITTPENVVTTITKNMFDETVSIVDASNKGVSYAYDRDGNVTKAFDAVSNTIESEFDLAGRVKKTTDANKVVTTYEYDAANRVLKTIVDPAGLNLITTYRYDGKGQKIEVVGADGNVTAIEYDLAGNVLRHIAGPGAGKPNATTAYAYDASGRQVAVTEGWGTAAAKTTAYVYDKADRLIATRVDPYGLNLKTEFGYDSRGNVLWRKDAAGDTTYYQYDSDNRQVLAADREGRVTETFYDKEGRIVGTLRYAARATIDAVNKTFAQPAKNADADQFTNHVFDGDGRLRFTIDPLRGLTEYRYDAHGNLELTVRYGGPVDRPIPPSTLYDVAGAQAQIAKYSLGARPDLRGYGVLHDVADRPWVSVNEEGYVTAYAYDGNGNVVKQTRFDDRWSGEFTAAGLSAWMSGKTGRVDRSFYDAAGRVQYSVDAENFVTAFTYDGAGRVKSETRYAEQFNDIVDGTTAASVASLLAGANAAKAAVTRYGYDSAGRLTDITDPLSVVTHHELDALGQAIKTYYAYGTTAESITARTFKAGRLASEIQAFGATYPSETVPSGTPYQSETVYTYDGVGRVLTIKTGAKQTAYEYDALGHVKRERNQIDASTWAETETTYDSFGNAVKVKDPRGNVSYAYYDALNRVRLQVDAGGHDQTGGYATETTYTLGGAIASVTRRAKAVSGTYSENSRPTVNRDSERDATTWFVRDKLDRITDVIDAENKIESYVLNAFGHRKTVTSKSGGVTTYVYDKLGRATRETVEIKSELTPGVTTTIVNTFSYDARGNMLQKVEASNLAEKRTTTYEYDKLNRVKKMYGDTVGYILQPGQTENTDDQPTEQYRYDQLGNLIEKIDALNASTRYYYDKMGRVVEEIDALRNVVSRQYDVNGNLVSERQHALRASSPTDTKPGLPAKSVDDRVKFFSYDGLNRLLSTTQVGVLAGSWTSGGYQNGVANLTTSFEYDAAGNVIRQTDPNGNVIRNYYDKLGNRLEQIDQEGYMTSWRYDAEGNVTTDWRWATRVEVYADGSHTSPTSIDNRVTQFTYDRNGRRLSEQRWLDGTKAQASADSIIRYTYNALGQVLTKREATGDQTSYTYDNAGRLEKEQRAKFRDQTNNEVTPTTTYKYDGLNNLLRTTEGMSAERVTTYVYGAGGRLASMTNAAGDTFSYAYDRAGNVLRESYVRRRVQSISAQGAITYTDISEALLYVRDALGRVTGQGNATLVNGAWQAGIRQNIRYNTFGDVTGRGSSAWASAPAYQEQFVYDVGSRLTASNSGDGVWRYFVSDKAGNQTLVVEDEGSDLAGKTLEQVIALSKGNGAAPGYVYVDRINTTAIGVDKRGQAIAQSAMKRQLNAATVVDVSTTKGYNAFGEVAWEKNAEGAQTSYTYNTMGRVRSIVRPTVSVTFENGTRQNVAPTESFRYDLSGRLTGTTDANGNRTTRELLAGTGYGGSEALVTAELHADNGVARTYYDQFGDARLFRSELYAANLDNFAASDESRSYDKMGRLTTQVERGGLTHSYLYDLLGQRILHTNTVLGAANAEITDYDLQGRVTRQVAFGGDTTTTSYAWDATLQTADVTVGGWTTTTTLANSLTSIEKEDVFGHALYKKDLGGRISEMTYDKAGRLVERTGAGAMTWTWLNSGLVDTITATSGASDTKNWSSKTTSHGYDVLGNLVAQYTVDTVEEYYQYSWDEGGSSYYHDTDRVSSVVQNATADYDTAGRLLWWSEAGTGTAPAARTDYEYDANGNIRRTRAAHRFLNAQGGDAGAAPTKDLWYKYDVLNRVTLSAGRLEGGSIVGGEANTYNAAGQRMTTTRFVAASEDYGDPNDGGYSVPYEAIQRESYSYTTAGQLDLVYVVQGGSTTAPDGTLIGAEPSGTGTKRADYDYDGMGRVTRQIDYDAGGTVVQYQRDVTYNGKGQITGETTNTRRGADIFRSTIVNNYGTGTSYALGAVVWSTSRNDKFVKGTTLATGSANPLDTRTDNTIGWYDGAVTTQVRYDEDAGTYTYSASSGTYTEDGDHDGNTIFRTTYSYNDAGQLQSAQVNDGRPRTVTYTNDMTGQVIRRDEADNKIPTQSQPYLNGDPHEAWYRFGGKQMGYVGNNGTLDTDYQSSVSNRTATAGTGAFRNGGAYGGTHADFDLSTSALTSYSQGGSGGSYTVQGGETLTSIAAQLWGDASLWYKLAEANGLSASNALMEGQRLTIPAGVMKNTHNASTFKPYDPAEAMGETSPTTPKPQTQKSNKCGVFGQLVLAVVAVAVTFATAGTFAAAMGPVLGGIATGATASIVSQAVGVATGIQDGFNWKGVAMSAIAGGVSAGLDKLSGVKGLGFLDGGSIGADVARGAIANGVGQGLGVALQLQSKFSWAGVAAAGISAGVSGAAGRSLPGAAKSFRQASFGNQTASGFAGAISGAATRSVLTGTSFGDNIIAVLPDVIASTIGNAAVRGLKDIVDYQSQRGPEYASTQGLIDRTTVSSEPEIVVTGHVPNVWDKLQSYANTALEYIDKAADYVYYNLESSIRARAESSNLGLVARGLGIVAERAGFHSTSVAFNKAADFYSGQYSGAAISILDRVSAIGRAVLHPVTALEGVARTTDALIMSNPSDFANAARAGIGRARAVLASGDARAIGELSGRTGVAVADIFIGSKGLGALRGVEAVGDLAGAGRATRVVGSAAETVPTIAGPTGKAYSVAFETKLDASVWGKSDSVHFNRANAALDDALRSDPVWAAQMEEMIPGVQGSVAKAGGRATPEGWVWHHDVEPGTMQLSPTNQHWDPKFWNTFHPDNKGGYAIWARPAGAPPRK
ncbi:HNH endonuclease [Allosphingosinicella deserti]|nr:HNH endonuclease [Sphingomonas deserti]